MENKSKVWTLRAAAVLLILVLATVVWSSGMFARFVSFASGGDGARVAKFSFKVSNILHQDENGVVTDVTDYLASSGGHNIYVDPGINKTTPGKNEALSHFWYEYTVENDSEVTVSVTFKAKVTHNLPYRVYFAGSKILDEISAEYEAKGNDNIYRVNYGDLAGYTGDKTITLTPGQSQTVYLWMDWANPDNGYEDLKGYDRSYEIDQFTVTIDCRQVD